MRIALRLARRAAGRTSPNPAVGALLVKDGAVIGQGWHRGPGRPHAEIEALLDAQRRRHNPRNSTLYVSLEPCCTFGRTPPCTEAILSAGIRRVVAGAIDPNPLHRGQGLQLLQNAGVEIVSGVLAEPARLLNEPFNHWIVHRTPFVTLKSAMTLDGKIATVTGESKWITAEKSRAWAMRLRKSADAILTGINTVLADDPSLTVRPLTQLDPPESSQAAAPRHPKRRIVLDSLARTPLDSKLVTDPMAHLTTIFAGSNAPAHRLKKLRARVDVRIVPKQAGGLDLNAVLAQLGAENVTHLLVEGGGRVNAAFLLQNLVHRVAFFYAPKIVGGRHSRKAVAGPGIVNAAQILRLDGIHWRRLGPDLLLTANVER